MPKPSFSCKIYPTEISGSNKALSAAFVEVRSHLSDPTKVIVEIENKIYMCDGAYLIKAINMAMQTIE